MCGREQRKKRDRECRDLECSSASAHSRLKCSIRRGSDITSSACTNDKCWRCNATACWARADSRHLSSSINSSSKCSGGVSGNSGSRRSECTRKCSKCSSRRLSSCNNRRFNVRKSGAPGEEKRLLRNQQSRSLKAQQKVLLNQRRTRQAFSTPVSFPPFLAGRERSSHFRYFLRIAAVAQRSVLNNVRRTFAPLSEFKNC